MKLKHINKGIVVKKGLPRQFLFSHMYDGPQSVSTKQCTMSLGAVEKKFNYFKYSTINL